MGHFNKGPSESPIRKVLRFIVKAGRQKDTGVPASIRGVEVPLGRWLLEGEHSGFWTLMDRGAALITCYRKKPQRLPPRAHLCILTLGHPVRTTLARQTGTCKEGFKCPSCTRGLAWLAPSESSPGTWDLGRMTLTAPSREDLNKGQS